MLCSLLRLHKPQTCPGPILARRSRSLQLSPSRFFASSFFRNTPYVRFQVDPNRPFHVRGWGDPITKVAGALVLLAGVYYVAHLEKMPETGRLRFIDVSPKFEASMAKASRESILNEFKGKILPPDHPTTRYVRHVVTKLIESSNLGTLKSDPSFITPSGVSINDIWAPDSGRKEDVVPGSGGREWELMVVDDRKVVNAMASYGNILIFTGILPISKDEDGLAAVIGHEMGHVVARHDAERYSSVKVLLAIVTLLDAAGLGHMFSQMLTTYLLELPNSRTQELEADKIGLRLSAQACYDPRAASDVFTRLDRMEKSRGMMNIGFLNTHPSSAQRAELLEQMLPEAYSIRAASPVCAAIEDNLLAFGHTVGFHRLRSP